MKIAIAQLNYTIGDIEGNFQKIAQAAAEAKTKGATHLVIAKDALTGTPTYDMRFNEDKFPKLIFDGIEVISSFYSDDNFIIIPSADKFYHGSPQRKFHNIQKRAKRTGKTIIYVNQVGASTDIIYPGGSVIAFCDGKFEKLPLFEECLHFVGDGITSEWGTKNAQLYSALTTGIRDYFKKNNLKKAVIAMSGGIDSALVAALAVASLGSENVRFLMLPSVYSSNHSISDSIDLATNLQVDYEIINIEPIVNIVNETLQPIFNGAKADVTEENIQSRIRMVLTMAISNKTGALMLNTSNKSEISVGYGTLYGDCGGALGVIADIYKTEVYSLSRYINKTYGNIIPIHIITKAPSAELRPDQKDTDSLPDYSNLDKILYLLIEKDKSIEDDDFAKFAKTDVERAYKLLYRGDFKRSQLPPPLRVSVRSFKDDRKYPITKSLNFPKI